MQENKKRKNVYAAVLLCMFISGNISALAFLAETGGLSAENAEIVKFIPVVLVMLDCLLFSSMIGLVLLPFSTFIAGISSVILISVIENKLFYGDEAHFLFIVLAVLVPLGFVISSEGMEISWQLRHLMSSRRNGYRKKLLLSYSIMFIGMALLVMLGRHILTI